jgi:hypothetical protein
VAPPLDSVINPVDAVDEANVKVPATDAAVPMLTTLANEAF